MDVYANAKDLRRLGRECGFEGNALDQIVKLVFVNGFPNDISKELQQMDGMKGVSFEMIITRAQMLT